MIFEVQTAVCKWFLMSQDHSLFTVRVKQSRIILGLPDCVEEVTTPSHPTRQQSSRYLLSLFTLRH